MPETEVRAFRGENREVPIQAWLDDLKRHEPKVYAKCLARILELAEQGNQMRRPHADYLRDGIYELRASFHGLHYRMLYFFGGKNVAVLSHGLDKKDVVPPKEIERSMAHMKMVKRNPGKFTAVFDLDEGL